MWPFWPPYWLSAWILGNFGSAWLARSASSAVMSPVSAIDAEDVVVAGLELGLRVLARLGVEVVGVVENARQDGGLLEVEVLGRDVEVGHRGGLDAVGAAAEVDGVEVALEDLLLALLALELQGEEGLLELALEGPLLGEVEDLHVLLGDRRRALRAVAAGVAERRPDDALGVDALVGPEALVLGRDDRLLDVVGHLAVGDRLAVLGREGAQLGLAVGVVDARRLGLEVGVGVGDRGLGVGVVERPDARQRGDQTDDQQPLQDGQHPSLHRLLLGRALGLAGDRRPVGATLAQLIDSVTRVRERSRVGEGQPHEGTGRLPRAPNQRACDVRYPASRSLGRPAGRIRSWSAVRSSSWPSASRPTADLRNRCIVLIRSPDRLNR